MTKSSKILLGVATFWPLLYMCLFMLSIVAVMTHGFDFPFPLLFVLHMLTMLWIMGLMGYYVFNIVKDEQLKSDLKILWVLVIVMGSMLGMPIYWYVCIWKNDGYLVGAKKEDTKYIPPAEPPDWRRDSDYKKPYEEERTR